MLDIVVSKDTATWKEATIGTESWLGSTCGRLLDNFEELVDMVHNKVRTATHSKNLVP